MAPVSESIPADELIRRDRAAGTYVERLRVGVYWGRRAETPDEIAGKILRTVGALEPLDGIFQPWYVVDPPGAIPTDITELAAVVRTGVHRRNRDGSVIEELGWQVMMFSGGTARNDPGAKLSVHAGSTATRVGNTVVLSPQTPAEHGVFLRLGKELVGLLVAVWQPDWAVFTSATIADEVSTFKRYPAAVSWFSDRLGALPGGLDPARVEQLADGTLIDLLRDGQLPPVHEVVELRDRLAAAGILGEPKR